jgi:subtilisin family serine protease
MNKTSQTKITLAFLLTLITTFSALSINPTFEPTSKSELLIRFKPGVSENSKEKMLASLGLEVADEIPQINVLVVSAPQNTLPYIKSALPHNSMIDLVEENPKISLSETPNDKYYGLQWHLQKIQAPDAWNITKGEPNIILAILDTGIDPNHPDLKNKLLEGYNAYDDSNNVTDDIGHGTIVTGAAASITNNTLGISAIAWKNSILPIKINLPRQGYTTFSLLAKGLIYAADKGAKVASISWLIFNGTLLTNAAKYFTDKGGLVIAAAGNTGKYESYTDNPYIITVAATNSSDLAASFSSYGPYVDISAPGVGIFTTISGKQATSYDYAYGYASGTSLSTPITAGLAALIFSANPSLTPSQVEQILKSSAVDLGNSAYDFHYGWGRINASKAVRKVTGNPYPPPPSDTTPNVMITYPNDGATISGSIVVTVDTSDDVAVSKVELYKNGALFAVDYDAPYEFYWDTNNDPDGVCTLLAKAYDTSNNIGESNIVSVNVANKAKDTTPPTINIIQPINGSTLSGTIDILVSAWDESGIQKIEFYINDKLKATDSAQPYTYRWNTKKIKDGWYWITVKAYDNSGNISETKIRVYVSNRK